MIRSDALFVKSRSCHSGTFSRAGMTRDRTTRESEHTFSDPTGFSFWAIVELPTCFFASNASATSPISDRKSTRLNSSHSQISYAVFCLTTKRRGKLIAPPTLPKNRRCLFCDTFHHRKPQQFRGCRARVFFAACCRLVFGLSSGKSCDSR